MPFAAGFTMRWKRIFAFRRLQREGLNGKDGEIPVLCRSSTIETRISASGLVPRFLLVGPLPPPASGQSLAFEMLCGVLRDRGYDCRVVNVQGKNLSSLGRLTLKRSMETLQPLARFTGGLIGRYRRVYITVSRSRAGFLRDMVMIWIAWLCRSRVIVHVKGGNYDVFYRAQPRPWRILIRQTLRRVHCIIVLSTLLRGMFDFDPVLRGRIAVVPNGLPFPLNGPPQGRHWRQGQPVRILFLSNLIQSKGYFDVLKAMAILQKMTPIRLEAVFAGHFLSSPDDPVPMSPQKAKMKFHEDVVANGLENMAYYMGPVSGEVKRRILNTSDFFVLPTRYFTEGQPISIIEAMAHGCVVIATNYRAIPDMVVNGVTGVLVEPARPDQIANAIRRIVAHPQRYETMSQAAVDRYKKLFTMERHLDMIVPLLKRM